MAASNEVLNRRQEPRLRPVSERTADWHELYLPDEPALLRTQGARCMDCGVPFCQGDTGCPVQNLVPEWNALVTAGRWQEASHALHATNNFPELTGRLCPAPCETACVLGVVDQPVTIRRIEHAIADRAFAEGWIAPMRVAVRTGFRVAVVGSGPAGLAAAQQLARQGHAVTVFERDDRVGGLLRYGIPDFKLARNVLDARLRQLEAEGVTFETGVSVGIDVGAETLRQAFDAVVLAVGARQARDLDVAGRDLHGIAFAMDFLTLQNRRNAGDEIEIPEALNARGKHVVVIGGGDTGSDCIGTCHRQGAVSVRQIELLPMPPATRSPATPWPQWPLQLRTSHAHEEGGERDWSKETTRFSGARGRVRAVHTRATGTNGDVSAIPAELVLLAMGFAGVGRTPLYEALGVALNARQLIATDDRYRTSAEGVFAAGDARRGQSLIVWAIREGREVATAVGRWLRSGAVSSRAP